MVWTAVCKSTSTTLSLTTWRSISIYCTTRECVSLSSLSLLTTLSHFDKRETKRSSLYLNTSSPHQMQQSIRQREWVNRIRGRVCAIIKTADRDRDRDRRTPSGGWKWRDGWWQHCLFEGDDSTMVFDALSSCRIIINWLWWCSSSRGTRSHAASGFLFRSSSSYNIFPFFFFLFHSTVILLNESDIKSPRFQVVSNATWTVVEIRVIRRCLFRWKGKRNSSLLMIKKRRRVESRNLCAVSSYIFPSLFHSPIVSSSIFHSKLHLCLVFFPHHHFESSSYFIFYDAYPAVTVDSSYHIIITIVRRRSREPVSPIVH